MKLFTPPFIAFFLTACFFNAHLGAQTISTVVGCGIGDDSLATKAELFYPSSTVMDPMGNMYIADEFNYRIRKVSSASHTITTFAGTGIGGDTGDGGPATAAQIRGGRMTMDRTGNIYFASSYSVRKIDLTGIITTVAGTGVAGYSGDGGPAIAATFMGISDIAADTFGNLYIADFLGNRVRRVNSAGIVTTVAGGGGVGYSPDGTLAAGALLNRPFSVATDNLGNFYLGEYNNHVIRKIDNFGILSTVAGTGIRGYTGDGGPATAAEMTAPVAIKLDIMGNLYFSDNHNFCVRKVDAGGTITTIAGDGTAGFRGDGGPGSSAEMSTPGGLDVDNFGEVYISCTWDNRIREVTQAGIIITVAGQSGLFDDGIAGQSAEIGTINNMASDSAGRIYFADTYNNRIRMFDPASGLVTTVAGHGIAGYGDEFSGDGGPADSAHIYNPNAVTLDNSGNMYIADTYNQRIRKVDPAGTIITIAGKSMAGFSGDGGIADSAELNYPNNVAVDNKGNVYIGDGGNYRIRKVDATGNITTVAGTGVLGYSGDGGPAASAVLGATNDLFADKSGNIYIADAYNNRIRQIDTFGIIRTVAGNGVNAFSGDGGAATSASLSQPTGIRIDDAGNMYIADFGNSRVRKVDAAGIITTVAGNGSIGFSGDGGTALSATFNKPGQLAIGHNGDVYIADYFNFRIRKMTGTLSVPSIAATEFAINVFPNPATDEIVVSMGSLSSLPAQLLLYDATGSLLQNMTINEERQTVSMKHFAAGQYNVVVISKSGEHQATKVIKR